jgi:hypothetical protein
MGKKIVLEQVDNGVICRSYEQDESGKTVVENENVFVTIKDDCYSDDEYRKVECEGLTSLFFNLSQILGYCYDGFSAYNLSFSTVRGDELEDEPVKEGVENETDLS